MIKTGKPGPKKGRLAYPDYFQKTRKDIRNLPFRTLIKFIRSEEVNIDLGDYISVRRIVDYIIATDYKKEILEAARKVMLDISFPELGEEPLEFEQLGFKKTTPPFFLGALFETLPEPIAVELFWQKYSLDKNAGRSLLRFSRPGKAVQFIRALERSDPKETARLIQLMQDHSGIINYEFRRYGVGRLMEQLPPSISPQIKAKAEKVPPEPRPPIESLPKKPAPPIRSAPKTARKKAPKKKKAIKPRSSGVPKYFEKWQARISQQLLEDHLAAIKKDGAAIAKDSRYNVMHILGIVIGTDFEPQVMAAARDVLAHITVYRKTKDWPFIRFGFSLPLRPFYLGALFELLPQATAVKVFKSEFLQEGEFYGSDFIMAGRGLMRFSAADEAAEFIDALNKNTRIDLEKFLPRFLNNHDVRGYQFRRYEAEDLLSAFEDLID